MEDVQSENNGCIRIVNLPCNQGQSAAVWNGVLLAHAPIIGLVDGDGQNDPADLLRLYEKLVIESDFSRLSMVSGFRSKRKDTLLKRFSSRTANSFRRWVLQDQAIDTGCGIKVFDRTAFLGLPRFDHMHRFLPALFRSAGYRFVEEPVNHRPRLHGYSKYGLHNRLWVGIVDLFAVKWLLNRKISSAGVREEGNNHVG
jgi:dolichol-phosphate mannosyltransferase